MLDICWAIVWVPMVLLARSSTLRSSTSSLPAEEMYRSLPPLEVYRIDAPENVGGAEAWSARVSCCPKNPAGQVLPKESEPDAPAMAFFKLPEAGVPEYARNWPTEPEHR